MNILQVYLKKRINIDLSIAIESEKYLGKEQPTAKGGYQLPAQVNFLWSS